MKSKLVSKASDVMSYRPKPSLSLDARDLPEIKDWQIGKTYTITVQAKMVSISTGDEYDDYGEDNSSRPARARFRITSVKDSAKK